MSNLESCLFLNTFYPAFMADHYARNPGLSEKSYDEQKASLQATFFGDSDFYSRGLTNAGWAAEDVIINCSPLQERWATENGFLGHDLGIAVEQIKRKRPDVLYFQNMAYGTREFIAEIRPYVQLIVGQVASPVLPQTYVEGFDIIFSSFPHFVDRFRARGVASYYQPLAFEPRVLEQLPASEEKFPVTFIGGISSDHGKGLQFLEELAALVPMEFWGYGAPSLPPTSPIRRTHHGEAWGLEMFSLLNRSAITVNRHIDVAENNANNMRLFEATGCGALLITDYKDNLNDLFEIGQEVVAYRSAEECAALIHYYLANPEDAARIAAAGQARTLRDHSYEMRMAQTARILRRHLRQQREDSLFPMPDLARISYGKEGIHPTQVSEAMTSAWQSAEIPMRQRALANRQLMEMYAGKPAMIYQLLAETIRPLLQPESTILEIGCASGYYYEILEYLLKRRISYTGVDYSEPLIAMAKDYYPQAEFLAADGANLPYEDNQFTIGISSCVLLHVPNYLEHIAETIRVSDKYVIAHRTPVCRATDNRIYKKFAYGVETVELIFNEQQLLAAFQEGGLKLLSATEYHTDPHNDHYELTYLFEKTRPPQQAR